MLDNDDNYYDVSNEDFVRIRNTGKPIYDAPVFMQKVKMPATNPNFIQVGMVCFRDNNETKAIFMRRTKNLEEGQRQAIDNFSKAIAPHILDLFFMCRQAEEDYEKFIANQTSAKDKKIQRIKNRYHREIEQIEKEYNQRIDYVKGLLQKKKSNNEA